MLSRISTQAILFGAVILLLTTSCTKGDPYFSGANQFKVDAIAPEGIKVVGTLWYHNTLNERGDHMAENLMAHMEGKEPLPVNFGREHVIMVGGNARYDVPVVFYVPMDYVTDGVEDATLLSNKKKNRKFEFTLKGTGTILVGPDRYDMPVEHTDQVVVWPDL